MAPALLSLIAVPAVVVAATLPLVWILWRGLRMLGSTAKLDTPAVRVAAFAAVGCTAYSADTSWRFAGDMLQMASVVERAALFATAELALFGTALMARQNLHGPSGAPGVPGVIVWVITGVQIIPAYTESGPIGGTVRAFFGPVMAAMLWHLAMGIELRHRKPEAESAGLAAVLGRELRERLLSRLGIAERDRDAAQITRDRATARAVALAARLAEQSLERRDGWNGRRTTRRLSKAVARASVGTDCIQRRKLLEQLAARRNAGALATVDLVSPWDEQAPDPAASALASQAREQMRQATENIRRGGYPRVLFPDVVPAQGVNAEPRSPEQPALGQGHPEPGDGEGAKRLSTAKAQKVIEDGWTKGLSVRETAQRATRAPSYVHGVFVKLDDERGPRPTPGQLTLVSGRGEPEPESTVLTTP
ncbi:hypothetical protein [Streptomyces griseocarneus]|uniref:hypothetical protein n=1 Tax=Streptomyces griseocarneus TaxID=51201 RepID=UPI0019B283E4|nr:hypothetical protein [Streptomyces griseocarneus]MBZ6473213.1 hypothetical protein [Streptomyces griseocarneus]GHG60480.1 hypothetical protein GCM10018779_27830 [Streptomyces griseocarneus]